MSEVHLPGPTAALPTATMPAEVESPVGDTATTEDAPWVVIVWNDPINLIDYVALVLQRVFGYSKDKAMKLTMEVHHNGRSVVASGDRTESEVHVYRLHEHGLWATMQQDT